MSDRVSIIVSGKSLRQPFNPCVPDYIRSTCRGRCCESSKGILVTVHPSERGAIEALGAEVRDGFVVPDDRGLCPFKTDDGLCGIHQHKPFGCRASPFTLTTRGTLIVRNRYRMLRCFKTPDAVPACIAHAMSLRAVLGDYWAGRVTGAALAGVDRIEAEIDAIAYRMLLENDDAKRQVDAVPLTVAGRVPA